jgi:hypothetical protein
MDDYWFFEMLATYDDHHVSNDDDEGVTDVKKKLYIYKAEGFGCSNICVKN